jgi:hypothetical protein
VAWGSYGECADAVSRLIECSRDQARRDTQWLKSEGFLDQVRWRNNHGDEDTPCWITYPASRAHFTLEELRKDFRKSGRPMESVEAPPIPTTSDGFSLPCPSLTKASCMVETSEESELEQAERYLEERISDLADAPSNGSVRDRAVARSEKALAAVNALQTQELVA